MIKVSAYVIFLICILTLINPGQAFSIGYGYYLEYDQANLEPYEEYWSNSYYRDALKQDFVVGLTFDTNVSTARVFHYRLSLGLAYTNIRDASSDANYYQWNNKLFAEEFNDEGYSISMKHEFLFRLWQNKDWMVWIGPGVQANVAKFTANERDNWRYSSAILSGNTGCYYHIHPNYTIGSSISIGTGGYVGNEIVDGQEVRFAFRLSLFYTLERLKPPAIKTPSEETVLQDRLQEQVETMNSSGRNEQTTKIEGNSNLSAEQIQSEIIYDKFEDLETVDTVGIPLAGDTEALYGSVLIETFPTKCTIISFGMEKEKEKQLCRFIHIEPGSYTLTLRWHGRELQTELDIEAGQNHYVRASFIRNSITVTPLLYDVFIDRNDGFVEDIRRNLLWLAKDSDDGYTWLAADQYCTNLKKGLYIDWRLPSLEEMGTLFSYTDLTIPTTSENDRAIEIAPLFSIEHKYLWTSTLGPRSPILVDRPAYFVTPSSGRNSWASPFRKFGILPVHWADNESLPAPISIEEAFENRDTDDVSEMLKTAGIYQLTELTLEEKLNSSEGPVLVMYYLADDDESAQLASVFIALSKQYGGLLRFLAVPVSASNESLFIEQFRFKGPVTICMYRSVDSQMKLIDRFSKSFTNPIFFKQRMSLLSMWLYSNCIDLDNGIFYKGKYYRVFFGVNNASILEKKGGGQ